MRYRVRGIEARIELDQFADGSPAFHGYCPALRGCHTWARTQKWTVRHLREAIDLYVEDEDGPVFRGSKAGFEPDGGT